MLKAVIFDFDGVLVDSEGLHFQALRASLEAEGVRITQKEYVRHYLAYRDRESIRHALARHGRSRDRALVERIARMKARLFREGLPEVPLFEGARALVSELSPSVALAVASGARRPEIEEGLRRGGLHRAFRTIVSAEDVRAGKPAPDPYRLAMRRLARRGVALEPALCVAVEDSVAGVASARAAGMRVVGVTHSFGRSDLAAADLVVGSLRALSRERLESIVGR